MQLEFKRRERGERPGETNGHQQPQIIWPPNPLAGRRSARLVRNQPKKKLPSRLTASVPQGKAVPSNRAAPTVMPQRDSPPRADPKATRPILVSSCTCLTSPRYKNCPARDSNVRLPPKSFLHRGNRLAPDAAVDAELGYLAN